VQKLIRSLILLIAIVVDPRDKQAVQRGGI
jgi:hypothetical protein